MSVETQHIKFREGDQILTLWVEKTYGDGWVVGWCPERHNNILVAPANIVQEDE